MFIIILKKYHNDEAANMYMDFSIIYSGGMNRFHIEFTSTMWLDLEEGFMRKDREY